jgi:hypothetical protein
LDSVPAWWASREDPEQARKWIAFFEQLPEDNPLLVRLSSEYTDADAFHYRQVNRASSWKITCTLVQKSTEWEMPLPPRPDPPDEADL